MLYADHYTRPCTVNTPRAAIAECGTDDQRQALIEDEEWGFTSLSPDVAPMHSVRNSLMILPGSFAPPRTGTEFPGPRTGAMGQVFVHYDLAVPSNHVYTGHRKQGPHTERETMTSKIDRITTARYGTDAQRQELINDEDGYVRATVAECGTEAQRQELINDEDWYVRVAIARTGTESQRQALIDDPDRDVRATVAQYGTEAQRQELTNDEDWYVREVVARYGTDAQR